MVNPSGLTNAQLSKEAEQASAKAEDATSKARDSDVESHSQAGMAHSTAEWKNRDAGNDTKAKEHAKQARLHHEKADEKRTAERFAEEMSTKAETLSRKARMAAFGPDKQEPRDEGELHRDAAAAHKRASKAHELAGCERGVKYHDAQVEAHKKAAPRES